MKCPGKGKGGKAESTGIAVTLESRMLGHDSVTQEFSSRGLLLLGQLVNNKVMNLGRENRWNNVRNRYCKTESDKARPERGSAVG